MNAFSVVALAFVLSQPIDDLPVPPGTILAAEQLQLPPGTYFTQTKEKVKSYPSYNEVYDAKSATPYVLFVGIAPRDVVNAISCVGKASSSKDAQSISVVYKERAWRFYHDVSDAEIQVALRTVREEVSLSTSPFSAPSEQLKLPRSSNNPSNLREAADGNKSGPVGPWPKSLPFPDGLMSYERATYTQRTFNKGIIERVSRFQTPTKWHQSGGMEGISDYRSDVYKKVPQGGKLFTGVIAVLNSLGYHQDEYSYQRSYPNGTMFIDALSHNGKSFEIRKREKQDGKWSSKVIFTDHDARPARYKGLIQSCANCHDEAGTGGYATALVPGGDTVLSDPFFELERR